MTNDSIDHEQKGQWAKELKDMTFDEVVKIGVEREIDALISGENLGSRVKALIELGELWKWERTKSGKWLHDN